MEFCDRDSGEAGLTYTLDLTPRGDDIENDTFRDRGQVGPRWDIVAGIALIASLWHHSFIQRAATLQAWFGILVGWVIFTNTSKNG